MIQLAALKQHYFDFSGSNALFAGRIVAIDAARAAIRFVPKYKGGTHRRASIANTVLGLTQEIRSRACIRTATVVAPSWCKQATPLGWNSGVLTMPGGQVRSDHPWAPGSTLMATPRRNRSLEILFRLSFALSRSELHDRRSAMRRVLDRRRLQGAIVYDRVALVFTGMLLWLPRFSMARITKRDSRQAVVWEVCLGITAIFL